MFSKLKQFKDLRDKAKQLQSALSGLKVEGSGGWGKVKVTMDGNQTILDLVIDDALLADKAKLQSGLKEALQDALKKAQRLMMDTMKDVGGLDLPGLK
ncbi:YbaB/EbfC family nucleoid-associated protein [Candidatus Uhrbacteria bacterium]|nr:YbaB/EbfC family nucleoid-associated protein [Candidatus Uhrbacteria bacterium]